MECRAERVARLPFTCDESSFVLVLTFTRRQDDVAAETNNKYKWKSEDLCLFSFRVKKGLDGLKDMHNPAGRGING
jgi:hypothetical protein